MECIFIAQISDKQRTVLTEIPILCIEELQKFYFSPSIIWGFEIIRAN